MGTPGSEGVATMPAGVTIGESPLLDALNAANAADQAARQALDTLNATCPTEGSCGGDQLRLLRDTLARARATCVERREDYYGILGNAHQDDPSVTPYYPKMLDHSHTNPLTHQPFTCGR